MRGDEGVRSDARVRAGLSSARSKSRGREAVGDSGGAVDDGGIAHLHARRVERELHGVAPRGELAAVFARVRRLRRPGGVPARQVPVLAVDDDVFARNAHARGARAESRRPRELAQEDHLRGVAHGGLGAARGRAAEGRAANHRARKRRRASPNVSGARREPRTTAARGRRGRRARDQRAAQRLDLLKPFTPFHSDRRFSVRSRNRERAASQRATPQRPLSLWKNRITSLKKRIRPPPSSPARRYSPRLLLVDRFDAGSESDADRVRFVPPGATAAGSPRAPPANRNRPRPARRPPPPRENDRVPPRAGVSPSPSPSPSRRRSPPSPPPPPPPRRRSRSPRDHPRHPRGRPRCPRARCAESPRRAPCEA